MLEFQKLKYYFVIFHFVGSTPVVIIFEVGDLAAGNYTAVVGTQDQSKFIRSG